jgi:phosphatidylglycerol:prolipoprotein diacylglycerol transferase
MIAYPNISPEIFSIGFIHLRWYGLMYVLGYMVGFALVKWRIRKGYLTIKLQDAEVFISYYVIGMLLGARIFYALFYNWELYKENPIEILYVWQGGLSFHGAAVGMIVASWLLARRFNRPFLMLADTLAFAASPGLFFGRMGNFINAELYGRPTNVPWAMIFPTDPQHLPRHPSQLYQAFTEGVLLSLILWWLHSYLVKRNKFKHGIIGPVFLILYGTFRFITEFAREPDSQLGLVLGPFSMGQVLCAIMVLSGLAVLGFVVSKRPIVTITPPPA